jgi:hypothetical protein
MQAFVQVDKKLGFTKIHFLTAFHGFYFYGYDVQLFNDEELPELLKSGKINRETPVLAGIPIMDAIFEYLKVNKPVVPYYPLGLIEHLGRSVCKLTLQNAIRRVLNTGQKLFIKPLEEEKKTFNGFIAEKFEDFFPVVTIPQDCTVWTSSVIDFTSEYRCFVYDGAVLDMRHYKGSWRNFPNASVIDNMIRSYANPPIAYSLDVGVTSDGYTKLVECNDATSLGCYGLDKVYYGKMLIARWKEITQTA